MMHTENKTGLQKLACLSHREWEQLCDGCARCCLHKIEFEGTGEIVYTRIACRYLDQHSCRCGVYEERTRLVPTCCRLAPDNLEDVYFMPETCAYRLLAHGQPLASWHPLVSGDAASVHEAGISVRGRVVSESDVDSDDWPAYVIDWVQ
ncbi:MAG: YcgN family cysteine cluster protein [Deltaproteobacteria bacterium]|nr:YcgN family cysteine cluster protein [Deltaproteobacteria bacterium]